LYTRVLPTTEAIKKCAELGFLPNQIIAAQGPFCTRFNAAMIEQYHIEYLVTKDSGRAGGVEEKLEAAEQAGIETVIIRRPTEV
jgi:precorrin-6x reductase